MCPCYQDPPWEDKRTMEEFLWLIRDKGYPDALTLPSPSVLSGTGLETDSAESLWSFSPAHQLHFQNDITPACAGPRVLKLWQVSGKIKSASQMKTICSGFPSIGTGEVNLTHNPMVHVWHTEPSAFWPKCCCVVSRRMLPTKHAPSKKKLFQLSGWYVIFRLKCSAKEKVEHWKIKAVSLCLIYQGHRGLQASGIFCKWETIA